MFFKNASLCGAVLLTISVAAPAFAGPVGSGLGFTEETARRALQQRTVKVANISQACAQRAVTALQGRAEVAHVAHSDGGVNVTFHSAELAEQKAAEVRATVTGACAA
jgi:hypothetical protein